MTYSAKKVENDVSLFPEPQTWMTWVSDIEWRSGTVLPTGKLRHYHSLEAARKALRWIGSSSSYRAENERGLFVANWSVYHWDANRGGWVEEYSGKVGEERKKNPLFLLRFTKQQKIHPVDKKREDAAIESILRAARQVS